MVSNWSINQWSFIRISLVRDANTGFLMRPWHWTLNRFQYRTRGTTWPGQNQRVSSPLTRGEFWSGSESDVFKPNKVLGSCFFHKDRVRVGVFLGTFTLRHWAAGSNSTPAEPVIGAHSCQSPEPFFHLTGSFGSNGSEPNSEHLHVLQVGPIKTSSGNISLTGVDVLARVHGEYSTPVWVNIPNTVSVQCIRTMLLSCYWSKMFFIWQTSCLSVLLEFRHVWCHKGHWIHSHVQVSQWNTDGS